MGEPFRLRVLKSLSSALAEITEANGYKHDLTDSVFRGRSHFGDNDPVPMVSILESPVPIDDLNMTGDCAKGFSNWELLVQGFVQDDKDNPTDPAHHLMADVKQRLALERMKKRQRQDNILGMNGKVSELAFGVGVVRPPDEISSLAYFWLTVTLQLAEDVYKPYD